MKNKLKLSLALIIGLLTLAACTSWQGAEDRSPSSVANGNQLSCQSVYDDTIFSFSDENK